MSQDRYAVISPVEDGYAYYNVIDRESPICPNFAVATIHKDVYGASDLADSICSALNEVFRIRGEEFVRLAEKVVEKYLPKAPPTASQG